jgi:hypothetical protein
LLVALELVGGIPASGLPTEFVSPAEGRKNWQESQKELHQKAHLPSPAL